METPATVGDPCKLKLLIKLAANGIKYTETVRLAPAQSTEHGAGNF